MVILEKNGQFFTALVKLHLWLQNARGFPRRHCKLYFFAEQKNYIKWRRRRKKLGYSAKHAAFYTTESLNEPFLGVRLRVRLSSVSGKVVRGRRKTESRIPLFFFIFPQTSKPARSGFETSKSTQAISLPEIFRFFFFFFFRQTAKPGFCGFETAKKHLASALSPTRTDVVCTWQSVCFVFNSQCMRGFPLRIVSFHIRYSVKKKKKKKMDYCLVSVDFNQQIKFFPSPFQRITKTS